MCQADGTCNTHSNTADCSAAAPACVCGEWCNPPDDPFSVGKCQADGTCNPHSNTADCSGASTEAQVGVVSEKAVGWGWPYLSIPPTPEPTSAPKYDYNEYWDTASPIYSPTWNGAGKEAAVGGACVCGEWCNPPGDPFSVGMCQADGTCNTHSNTADCSECVNVADDEWCSQNEWFCDQGSYPGHTVDFVDECQKECNACDSGKEASVGKAGKEKSVGWGWDYGSSPPVSEPTSSPVYDEYWDTASPMYSPTWSGANQEAELAKAETEHFATPNQYILYGGIVFIGMMFALTIRHCNRSSKLQNNMEALLEHTEEL